MSSKPDMSTGTVAIAMVKRQIMIVQAARQHTKQERYLDVHTYAPFGERVFLASNVPDARISSSDILAVLSSPLKDQACALSQGMLELSQQGFSEYIKHSERHQKKYERMWSVWTASH